jgi:hypothetical protein
MKKTGIILIMLTICLPAIAGADHADIDRKVYLPHLTGTATGWQDFLVANNKGPQQQTFTLTLYNAGLEVETESYLVQPNEEKVIDIKQISSSATLGVVEFDSDYLTFRATFRHTSGGVAEFRLTDGLADQVMFNFTNLFEDLTDWKGIALANFENFTTDITLYAIGSNRQVLDSTVVSLSRRSRLVGFHTAWFPDVNLNDIAAIVVRSSEARVAGVTISGRSDNSALLFTSSTDAGTFSDGSFPDSVEIRDYFPIYQQTGKYDATEDVEVLYTNNGGDFTISVTKDGHYLRQWHITFDDGGGLRYYYNYYPMGYTMVNDPFTVVPAEADLNRLYTYNETWERVYYHSNNSSGQASIETVVQGPYYVEVPAGAFEDVIKLTIREQTHFNYYRGGSAVIYETVRWWLDKDFGIVKMSINGFEFEIESREDGD